MKRRDLETIQGAVAIAGSFLGVAPFPAHAFGFDPVLAATSRLPDPWWWVVSSLVCLASLVVLQALDRMKRHAPG